MFFSRYVPTEVVGFSYLIVCEKNEIIKILPKTIFGLQSML